MKLSVMQPYFCAYIGYYQLINNADKFVVYDNIEYTKKGWINRNRILINGEAKTFTIPLKNDSDFLNIKDRYLAKDRDKSIQRILGQIQSNYSKTPYFDEVFPIINDIFLFESDNLYEYIFHSIETICSLLNINTEIIISSSLETDTTKKSQDKVIDICNAMAATIYVNPIGGTELYDKQVFNDNNLKLQFLKTDELVYNQRGNNFISNLSIIDVLMHNSIEEVKLMLNRFRIV